MRSAVRNRRKPVPSPSRQKISIKSFIAPVRGWVDNANLAAPQPGEAKVLENFFPTEKGIRARGGAARHATVGAKLVASFITYVSGGTRKLFAASAGAIYDITSPVESGVPPAPAVSGMTADYYSFVQFANAGGQNVVAVNGADLHLVYNGASWAVNTPAITGVSSALLSHVFSFKSRLFFVQKNSLFAWYLPVDSLGGVAQSLSLAGAFRNGGVVLFGATWSLDAGDGLDDKCVFFSSNGEVVVFQGSNPGDANDWSIVGRYDLAVPMGQNATMQAGGDLLVCTIDGLVPLSAAVSKDRGAISLASISRNIEPAWKFTALNRATRPWEMVKWVEKNMAIIATPSTIGSATVESQWGFGYWGTAIWGGGTANYPLQETQCYVINLLTGAWARYTGWDAHCLAYHDGRVFFGTSDGRVMQAEVGGSDDGRIYECRYAGAFEILSGLGTKHLLQAQDTWTYQRDFSSRLTFSTDYELEWPAAPNAIASAEQDVWDQGRWDNAKWDSFGTDRIRKEWHSIGRTGQSAAPVVQITCGGLGAPAAELALITLTYENGGVVV
jgi:hypothetical protein